MAVFNEVKPGHRQAYVALARPGRIGSMVLPHRILMGSMHMSLEGQPDALDRLCEFYRARVVGGAALIITGGVAINGVGGGDNMYTLGQSEDEEALARIAATVHEAGGRIAMQLFHSGRYVHSDEIGMPALAPSAVFCRLTRETPRAMTLEEISETITDFARGAAKAKALGYDAVEVMGSEGYLLNQFLSPITNQREDVYGGSFENRMRASLDVVRAIRESVGLDYPVIFRMSGFDAMPGSTTQEETIAFAKRLATDGVDALNIGIGWHESKLPTVQQVVPRGGFASIAASIRNAVDIPVMGANRLNVPEVANQIVADGYLDFVAPARPWLADETFANKILAGDRDGLNVCIACNQSCLDHTLVRPQQPVSCLVNPRAGQELLWPVEETSTRKRVAVVGAGPAGLKAALTAAERGHEVHLFERGTELGGQFRMAGRIPGKDEFFETIRFFREMLERFGVLVTMQTEPSVETLATFDVVILAQGVKPFVPDIPGVDLPHVVTYAQVLNGEVSVAQKIAIIGAGGIGCDMALFLAEGGHANAPVQTFFKEQSIGHPPTLGRNITVLARSGRYGNGIGRSTRWVVKQEMDRLGVNVVTNFAFKEITPEGVRGETPDGEAFVEAEQVILCAGQESVQDLALQLASRVECHVVGGARDSHGINADRAIREAFEAAYQIGVYQM